MRLVSTRFVSSSDYIVNPGDQHNRIYDKRCDTVPKNRAVQQEYIDDTNNVGNHSYNKNCAFCGCRRAPRNGDRTEPILFVEECSPSSTDIQHIVRHRKRCLVWIHVTRSNITSPR